MNSSTAATLPERHRDAAKTSAASRRSLSRQRVPRRPTLSLLPHAVQVLAEERLGIDSCGTSRPRRPGREPRVGRGDFQPTDGCVVAGARVMTAVISSPASSRAVTRSGAGERQHRLLLPVLPGRRCARTTSCFERCASSAKRWLGVWPVTARISDASSAMMMPSLSVDHGPPSNRRNDAPALSSPPKTIVPLSSPSTNHLKPTGTSMRLRPIPATTRSISDELHQGLPTAAPRSTRRGG